MSNGKSCTHCGAIASIEDEQLFGRIIQERTGYYRADATAARSSAEPATFQVQIGKLFEWIQAAEIRVELETIDDADLIPHPNVLRAQVSMALNNVACPRTSR
jgi:hypothetical protein